MFNITLLVEKVVALMYLILAISMVVRTRDWVNFVEQFRNDYNKSKSLILFTLPFGILVILTHNIWVWNPRVIVTIFGWAAAIKSTLLLIAPEFLMKLFPKKGKLEMVYKIEGLIIAVLCGWVVWNAFLK